GRPRRRRAAHRGLSQDQPAGPRARAQARRRRAAGGEHRHPALSRQALRAVAGRSEGGGQGAVADRLLRRQRASRPRPCRPPRAPHRRTPPLPPATDAGAETPTPLTKSSPGEAPRAGGGCPKFLGGPPPPPSSPPRGPPPGGGRGPTKKPPPP